MSPSEIRELRGTLKCTARELAATLGIDASEVSAWEQGERFPTKRLVEDMAKLRLLGPNAVTRKVKNVSRGERRGLSRLTDPLLWQIVVKLAEHPEFFNKVQKLSEGYASVDGTDSSES